MPFNPYTQQMQDAPLNAFQAPLSANTMQLQAAPTGGLYGPLNQAVLGYYQAQREQNAAEQASVEHNAMIQAKMDELAYQHGRDTKGDARQTKIDEFAIKKQSAEEKASVERNVRIQAEHNAMIKARTDKLTYQHGRDAKGDARIQAEHNAMVKAKMDELAYQHGRDAKGDARQVKIDELAVKKQNALDKVAIAKATKEQHQIASTAKVIRATGKAKGLDFSMYADDELVQANKDKTLDGLYRASEPKVVKPVSVIGMANESESALVHKMIMSQLGTEEGDVNTGELEANVASMAGVLQAQHAKQGKMISYMDAVNVVIGKLAPKLVTTGTDDYIPFNENTSVQFNE